jgi:hypothetical protein
MQAVSAHPDRSTAAPITQVAARPAGPGQSYHHGTSVAKPADRASAASAGRVGRRSSVQREPTEQHPLGAGLGFRPRDGVASSIQAHALPGATMPSRASLLARRRGEEALPTFDAPAQASGSLQGRRQQAGEPQRRARGRALRAVCGRAATFRALAEIKACSNEQRATDTNH